MIKVTCLGAAGCVTGSCFLIENTLGRRVMVDCGLFQGGKQMELRNVRDWDFVPSQISTLFLTHAHIDHSGRIPKLVRDGFKGKIITSPPTAQLCEIMLLDAAHVQEMDAQWQTRKNRRKAHREIKPLYTTEDAYKSLQYLHPMEAGEIVTVDEGIKARLRDSGHILGASIIELWIQDNGREIKLVFSGDIGMANQLIIKQPQEIFNADYLFVESTYGNRLHKDLETSKEELLEAINYAVLNREKVIIPAFAVERTQELIYILSDLQRAGRLPDIPIFLDSPLAIKATEIFKQNRKYFDEDATALVEQGIDPFEMPNLRYSPTAAESMAINEHKGSAIVIAGSGMCTAGRIKHHLKHNLWREGASVVFVGFQAQGSPGRAIIEGKKAVRLLGEEVVVGARIFTIGGFSSHADQKGLLEWVGNFTESNPHVFVVHGESTASVEFSHLIHERLGLNSYVPGWRETLFLKPREFPIEVSKPKEEKFSPEEDILQVHASVMSELERLKWRIQRLENRDRITEEEIDRLRYIQEELQQILAA
ncbi:MAG TPA: MBL fold metallo-hydrolase [Deltaproteobacteria bacterium]|nr:MBL fold metallo-hydrolase [Deltaproteobacteria bacterium]HOI07812.1 MBL fold metallo-hydrolase [Deltaproteobacteria bacterium]